MGQASDSASDGVFNQLAGINAIRNCYLGSLWLRTAIKAWIGTSPIKVRTRPRCGSSQRRRRSRSCCGHRDRRCFSAWIGTADCRCRGSVVVRASSVSRAYGTSGPHAGAVDWRSRVNLDRRKRILRRARTSQSAMSGWAANWLTRKSAARLLAP